MPEESKAKEEPNLEVAALRQRVAKLERMEVERQRIEAALRESEKKYRRVVENAAEVIYTTDAASEKVQISSGIRVHRVLPNIRLCHREIMVLGQGFNSSGIDGEKIQ